MLQKHIAYYYFDQSNELSKKKAYIYYPHYKNALTIYKKATFEAVNELYTIIKPSDQNYAFAYAKLIKNAAKAEIHTPYNKIGVVFQPLGLNAFLDQDLSNCVSRPVHSDFLFFEPTMIETLNNVFETENLNEKTSLLDTYFLKVLRGFDNPILEKSVAYIIENSEVCGVEELADFLEVSRKTLLRLFRKHLNCSVVEYIKLVQFRKAIEVFNNANSDKNLTHVALESSYYDQSHFIQHFKKITGFNPKSFFKNLSDLGNQETYWTFD